MRATGTGAVRGLRVGELADAVGVAPDTVRYYERAGLLRPSRSKGNIRLYSPADVEQARQIKRLIEDLGVNLAGVEVILRLMDRLRQVEQELEELRQRCRKNGHRH